MANCKSAVSFSSPLSYLHSPPSPTRRITQMSLPRGQYHNLQSHARTLVYTEAKSFQFAQRNLVLKGRFYKQQNSVYVVSEDPLPTSGIHSAQENKCPDAEDVSHDIVSSTELPGTGGKPGLLSFYNSPYDRGGEILTSSQEGSQTQNSLLWFVGPAVLVASFVFPSLYLRRLLSAIFEDSLLTDFLILFFTEALFYCGVAVFLLMIDRLRRPVRLHSAAINSNFLTPQWGQRITSVAILVLSLTVPMVTMGLVWPWTGPAASATLAPYLVGIVVQFSFEQYARRRKSPSWSAIPIIFQIYRLHQLNRAAQLVTALSFTIKGVEMTSHNAAINSSLVLLLNVLQFLGIVCIWSLSSFLMRFLPSAPNTP